VKIKGVIEMKYRFLVLIFLIILSLSLASCYSVPAPLSQENAITAFSIVSPAATGVIDESQYTINITVPNGTNVTNLIAIFTASSGATVKVGSTVQQSGVTTNDFTNPVVYTVTAAFGWIQDYTVTVTVALPSTAIYVGTQSPGDYWSWTETTNNGSVTFTAVNNTKGFNYSGSLTSLTGNSSGFSELNITSSTDPNITTPTSAYELEIPSTMVMTAVAPFYTFNHSGEVQLSIHGPVIGAAQGSCPSTGTTTVNWIIMPNDNWCPAVGANIATGTCTTADNAYGTAVITVSSTGTYTISVTPYHLDGTSGEAVSLSSCTCSSGVIQCTDGTNPVHIAFTPSGVFIEDTANYGIVGVVQPASNIDITSTGLLASGNSFRGMVFDSWDDYYDGCTIDSDCNIYGISGGTCLSGHCGVPETQPISVTADGTNLNAVTYTNIATGSLNTVASAVNLSTASQPSPGLITTTITSPSTGCNIPGSFPFVMVATQINSKYVGFAISHSTCPTFDMPFNVFTIEQ
jgi:hypothetical protein